MSLVFANIDIENTKCRWSLLILTLNHAQRETKNKQLLWKDPRCFRDAASAAGPKYRTTAQQQQQQQQEHQQQLPSFQASSFRGLSVHACSCALSRLGFAGAKPVVHSECTTGGGPTTTTWGAATAATRTAAAATYKLPAFEA